MATVLIGHCKRLYETSFISIPLASPHFSKSLLFMYCLPEKIANYQSLENSKNNSRNALL